MDQRRGAKGHKPESGTFINQDSQKRPRIAADALPASARPPKGAEQELINLEAAIKQDAKDD